MTGRFRTGSLDVPGAGEWTAIPAPFPGAVRLGLKWSVRRHGWTRGWSSPADRASIAVLVSGALLYAFTADDAPGWQGVAPLTGPGDYVLWHPGVRHDVRALADSTVLTLRALDPVYDFAAL